MHAKVQELKTATENSRKAIAKFETDTKAGITTIANTLRNMVAAYEAMIPELEKLTR